MVLAQGQVVGLANHTVLLAKDGQEYQIADSAAPIRNASGEIVGVVLVFSDVTAKYRIGEALRESEEQFRILAALAPVGIYLTDAKGDCLYANTRWCAMAGMDMQAALGRGWVQGLHPDDRAAVLANWKQMVDSEGTWGMEYRFETADKRVTWVYALSTPYRDDGGKIVKYVGVNLDITERKRAEARVHESERLREAQHADALETQRQSALAALSLMEDALTAQRQAEAMSVALNEQLDELHRWQQVTLGRESRILSVKKEINELLAAHGQPPRYPSALDEGAQK
jgi:PAS domain S-box-containing protein